MALSNCWEAKGCGRNIGGERSEELGVCPAAREASVDGVNGGRYGGRAIAGTLCGGKVQGNFASKLATCMECDFYQQVATEQGREFKGAAEILHRIECARAVRAGAPDWR
jgi:hypothetical protein